MVSGSADESIAVWRCRTASEKEAAGGGGGGGGSRDGEWQHIKTLPTAHRIAVHSLHCAPSIAGHGRIASAGADDALRIFREEVPALGGSGTREDNGPSFVVDVEEAKAHDGDVNCVRWHPRDGTRLASVGDDGAVKVWRYRT